MLSEDDGFGVQAEILRFAQDDARSTISPLLDFILHLDRHIAELIQNYGSWTYGILGLIVFAETGFVVTPFLPGDSLLFAAGIFTHPERGNLNVWLLMGTLVLAAVLGDNVNYHVGKLFGERLFQNEKSKVFKRSHLEKTHAFFEKYGPMTIILARFVPIVRTFTPFVAGMGAMSYLRFLGFSIFAACLWVGVCVGAGHFFGGLDIVRKNFGVAILAIVALSIVPAIIEFWRHKRRAQRGLPQLDPTDDEGQEESTSKAAEHLTPNA